MGKYYLVQNVFTRGEISPKLWDRADIPQYSAASEILENVVILPHGGLKKRGGTQYVATSKISGRKVRLIPFIFSSVQSYVLEFGDGYMRVYRDGGQVMSGGSPYEISLPYTEDDLDDIQFVQDQDTMYLVHVDHPPATLTTTGDTSWTYSTITFTAPPAAWGPNDYPRTVAIYEQRLCFGGNASYPQTLWMSQSGNYTDMTTGTGASDAIEYTVASEQMNAIEWLSSHTILRLGTASGVFSVSASALNEAITPTNIKVVRDNAIGCYGVVPVVVGDIVLFVQRGGRKVSELFYDFNTDALMAIDITLLSEHIVSGKVKSLSYAQETDSVVWVLTDTGSLLSLTYIRDQKVAGWARHIIGGVSDSAGSNSFVESIAVVPNDYGEDELWLSVKRYINGSTVRHIEVMQRGYIDEYDVEDSFFLDSALCTDSIPITNVTATNPVVVTAPGHGLSNGDSVFIRSLVGMSEINRRKFTVANATSSTFELSGEDGTSYSAYVSGGVVEKYVSSLSGLDHLEGESVSILADGSVRPDRVVSGGAITLDVEARKVCVGLGTVSRVRTTNLTAGGPNAPLDTGRKRNVAEILVSMYRTSTLVVGGDTVPFRNTNDAMDAPVPLFTGVKSVRYPSGWDRRATVELESSLPLPMYIMSIMARINISG